jgi:uncharacterized cupin superfamily protein
MKPVVNLAEVPLAPHAHGDAFAARMGQIGPLVGARLLGCRLTVVPPGKRAWPYHCHHANEEMFVILEGTGTLRYGGALHPVRAGDVVACPPGGPETAHQIVNTGACDLRYLAISTMVEPEVAEYPDSGKFTVMAGSPPGGDAAKRRFAHTGRRGDALGYWEGEG